MLDRYPVLGGELVDGPVAAEAPEPGGFLATEGVGVPQDDQRAVAAQLEGETLQAGLLGDPLSHRRRAGEGHHRGEGMLDDRVAELRAGTDDAGATDRADSCSGKFHGEITATTPTGSR